MCCVIKVWKKTESFYDEHLNVQKTVYKFGPYSSRCSVVEAEIWTLLSLLPWMWLGFLLSKEETQISDTSIFHLKHE